jgi:glycosyltransferase involved in cell wall biosynthesis
VLTHYTDEAYHRNRIAVVDKCMQTYLAGAQGKRYELVIWDAGSTDAFRKVLMQYAPDVLVLAPNVGKATAVKQMANIARGEIFCYSDDDIYYNPGWLDEHMELLCNYPRPVMVSGSPQRLACNFGMGAVQRFAKRCYADIVEELTSEEDERLYALSIGHNWEHHKARIAAEKSYTVEFLGRKAWAHGHHMQYVTWRRDILPHLPESIYMLDNQRQWEQDLDDIDYLRLTTYSRSSWHMGNELNGDTIIVDGRIHTNSRKEG